MTNDPQVRTIEEATGVTRLSRSMLYKLMQSGRLAYVKIGRRRLIPADAIAQLIEASTVSTTDGQEVQACDR